MLPIAEVQKTFGVHGELIIRLRPEAPDEINLEEPVFIMIDGLPVPFYFQSFEPHGNHRALVVFDDTETPELAEELIGNTICLPMKKAQGQAAVKNGLLGYMVHDQQHGPLGIVSELLDIPGNPCLQIDYNGRGLIIPFNAAFIQKIDHKKHLLQMALPAGLLDL